MNGLIDLILENPLFLIIIIGAIFSMLRGKSANTEEESQQQTNNPKPKQAENPFERSRQAERTRSTEISTQDTINSQSIKELREEQMLRFSKKRESTDRQQGRDIPRIADSIGKEVIRKKDTNENQKVFKNDFNQSLTKKGLVNSVIMAEVLGAPRSRNAYQTVITKRRNK